MKGCLWSRVYFKQWIGLTFSRTWQGSSENTDEVHPLIVTPQACSVAGDWRRSSAWMPCASWISCSLVHSVLRSSSEEFLFIQLSSIMFSCAKVPFLSSLADTQSLQVKCLCSHFCLNIPILSSWKWPWQTCKLFSSQPLDTVLTDSFWWKQIIFEP